jgi:hypothetical protein
MHFTPCMACKEDHVMNELKLNVASTQKHARTAHHQSCFPSTHPRAQNIQALIWRRNRRAGGCHLLNNGGCMISIPYHKAVHTLIPTQHISGLSKAPAFKLSGLLSTQLVCKCRVWIGSGRKHSECIIRSCSYNDDPLPHRDMICIPFWQIW